jgi:hypothetical protein
MMKVNDGTQQEQNELSTVLTCIGLCIVVIKEEEEPTRCYLVFYYTSDRLNMFWAALCPSSGASGVPRNFFQGGVQQIQLTEDRENRDLGAAAPLVRSSGGSYNLVQEMSFHIVKFS